MTARNCWTCKHDEAHRSDGDDYVFHVCTVARAPALKQWIDMHVVPDSPGVPPSMPPKDAPPCPMWAPRGGAS